MTLSVKCLTYYVKSWIIGSMRRLDSQDLSNRRRIEDELLALGSEREVLQREDGWNRERIRRLVGPAREVGITVRDVSRMTGLSTQTLHTWMVDLMRPIPDIHLELAGPPPASVEQAALRVMGEAPARDWSADAVHRHWPPTWPATSGEQVAAALERLARWHMIWDGPEGYRVEMPAEVRSAGSPLP